MFLKQNDANQINDKTHWLEHYLVRGCLCKHARYMANNYRFERNRKMWQLRRD